MGNSTDIFQVRRVFLNPSQVDSRGKTRSIHQAAKTFRRFGSSVDAIELDLADLAAVDPLYAETKARPVDALLANAGHGLGKGFLDQDFADVRRVIDTNVMMMAPSASPMLMLFGASRAGRGERGLSMATLAFGLGYVAVWVGFSVGATFAQWELHKAAVLSSTGMALSSGQLSGGVLIGAGIYQLTAWKGRCLTHCRSPLGFLMTNWRDGTSGAFGMGWRHGIYCLGCCWALMCVLFAVGVMNLVWIAILAVLVLAEKIGPAGSALARFAGVALVLAGVLRLF